MIDHIDETAFEKKKADLLDKIGVLIEGKAILRAPVRTGNLRAKITHVVDASKNEVHIGTVGVPYAFFVEHGTVVMVAAHGPHNPLVPVTDWEALRKRGGFGQTMPFLWPAVFESEPEIQKLFAEVF